MSDIKRNLPMDPEVVPKELHEMHLQIQFNEKKSIIAGLKQRLKDLDEIEKKRLEFEIGMREHDIDRITKKITEVKNNG